MPHLWLFLPINLKIAAVNITFASFHWVEIAPELGKSTDCNQNLTTSEGDQDTSACQISGHSFHAFLQRTPVVGTTVRYVTHFLRNFVKSVPICRDSGVQHQTSAPCSTNWMS